MDYSFGLPDDVYALGYLARYLRSRSNNDLCTLDESRHFLRGVIPIPFESSEEEYCWGVWVEVSREDRDKYLRGFDEDLSAEASFPGRLANDIPGHGGTLGLPVIARFGAPGKRPNYYFEASSPHALARDQQVGISAARHHAILEAVGHFERSAA